MRAFLLTSLFGVFVLTFGLTVSTVSANVLVQEKVYDALYNNNKTLVAAYKNSPNTVKTDDNMINSASDATNSFQLSLGNQIGIFGLIIDIVGAWFLARGLVKKTEKEIEQESGTYY